jgi:hypothetical protein
VSRCSKDACLTPRRAPQINRRRLSLKRESRQAPPRYQTPISTRAPTVLIMDRPGRLVRARRDLDRAGSGGKRAPEPKADIVVPVVGGVPVAVGCAESTP